jgi:hypothetical protein
MAERSCGTSRSSGNDLLFVRNAAKDARGETVPYTLLGLATYVTHTGERPMSITWRLHTPMPPDMFEATKTVAG